MSGRARTLGREGISRRQVLATAGLVAAGLAVAGRSQGDMVFAAESISAKPGKPMKIPGKKHCYAIDYEICNTGDEPLRINRAVLQWPKDLDNDPAPQPLPDQILGWNIVGSTTSDGKRTVTWATPAPLILAKDPDGEGDGECTSVRLEFCCHKPKKVTFVAGGRLTLKNGSRDIVSAPTKVPKCG